MKQTRFTAKSSSGSKTFVCSSKGNSKLVCTAVENRAPTLKGRIPDAKRDSLNKKLDDAIAAGNTSLLKFKELINEADRRNQVASSFKSGNRSKSSSSSSSSPTTSKPKCKPFKCSKIVSLRQTDFTLKGVEISEPGYYKICENILYTAPNDDILKSHAIIVKSGTEGVIIDFDNHLLEQSSLSYDATENVSAIFVEEDVNDLVIKNGRIQGFSDNGIILLGDDFGSADDHHNVLIENMDFENLGKIETQPTFLFGIRGAVAAYGITDLIIRNCKAWNVAALYDSEAFFTVFCKNVLFEDLEARNINADLDMGFTCGMTNYFYQNASLARCRVYESLAQSAFGLLSYIGANSSMRNCESNNHNSPSPTSTGVVLSIAVYLTNGFEIVECTANGGLAQGDEGGTVNFNAGIQTAGASHGKILRCNTVGNGATSEATNLRCGAVGYDINGSDSIHLEDCFSGDSYVQTGLGGSLACGFDSDRSSNITHINCVAKGSRINGEASQQPSKICGFYASIIPEGGAFDSIVYRDCTAINNRVENELVTTAGFMVGEPEDTEDLPVTAFDVIIDHCIVQGCLNTAEYAKGYGIVLQQTSQFCSITNCDVQFCGIGIAINGEDSRANIVQNNRVSGGSLYGFRDTTGNPNMYAGNYSAMLGGGNYVGLPASTPIREWSISGGLDDLNSNGITDPLDNLAVTA